MSGSGLGRDSSREPCKEDELPVHGTDTGSGSFTCLPVQKLPLSTPSTDSLCVGPELDGFHDMGMFHDVLNIL